MTIYLEPTTGVISNITGKTSTRSIGGVSHTLFLLESPDTRNV